MTLKKGSAEAKAWAKRMLLHRIKKASIRTAGTMAERHFFGPKGVFAKAGHTQHLKNPKLSTPEKHMIRIALDTVRHPDKALLGGPSVEEAEAILRRYGVPFKRNPGAVWHEGMERVAARYGRDASTKEEKLLFKGVEVAHRDSARAARRMKMNPKKAQVYARRKAVYRPRFERTRSGAFRTARNNPLAVFTLGNPPQRINVGIAGIVYNRCLEIRAEKTGYKKGLYRHPFSRKSEVRIFALDNGDLLIHSTRNVRLWKRC